MAKGGGFVGVAQVLGGILDRNGLAHLFYEDELRKMWFELMGQKAGTFASLESLKDWKLRVRVENAAWRMDLHFQKEEIRQRANKILGRELVKEVILL